MVEWKPLINIVKSVSTGLNPRDNFVLNDNGAELYYVTVKDITPNRILFSDSTDKITVSAKEIINNRSKLEKGDILFSGIGTIGKVAYVDIPTNNWDCSESVFIIKPDKDYVRGKYLSYILSSDIAKNQYEKGAAGAIMKGVRKNTLINLSIPIPSFSEQNRIVGILDTFTASIENLKEQITQRRKQFEHYRDQFLDLEGKEGVKMKKLEEACEIRRGIRVVKKQLKDNALYPVFQNSIAPMGYYDQFNRDGNMPYIICAGSSSGSVGYCCTPFWAADDCFTIESSKVNRRYTYYALKKNNNNLFKLVRKGSMPRLPHEAIDNMVIPIPSLQEQSRIVSILDTFEASIANLEAQLSQREKQYEYYRNKLLTFE